MRLEGITSAYLRVSTQTQSNDGEGMEIQKNKISEYCEKKGYKLERIYEDRGISGTIRERPGLLHLLKDCESGVIKRIIVYKSDRLARELTVSLWIEKELKKYDVVLESVEDPPYDLEDPLQKAFKRIADVFAELEKDVITMRLMEGRLNNAKNGERGSGPIAFGYKKTNDLLEINPNEALWVHKIFKLAAKDRSYTEIIRYLSKQKVVTKRGKLFSIEALKYILRNKLYYGETNFGDINTKGVHEPIISKRMFVKVQRRFS